MVHKYQLDIKRFNASGGNSGIVYSGRYGTHSTYYYNLSVSFEESNVYNDRNQSHIRVSASLYGNKIGYSGAPNNWWEIVWYDDKDCVQGYQAVSSSITSLTKNTSKSISAEFDVNHKEDGTLNGYAVVNYHASGSGYSPKSATIAINNTALTTIPRYFSQTPNIWFISKDETSATFGWSTSEVCNWARYHLNGSSNWVDVFSGNGTSGSFTITGLTAGTPYNVYLECRRQDSGMWSNSNNISFDTYGYPNVSLVSSNFVIGDLVEVDIYNPLNRQVTIDLKQVDTNVTIESYSGTYNGMLSGFDSAETKSNFYDSIPNSKTGNAYAKITCAETGTTANSANVQYSINEFECYPSFTTFDINDSNTDIVALTGSTTSNPIFVKGYSIPKVIISSANKATLNDTYPAGSIVSYDINFENGSKSVTYSESNLETTLDTWQSGSAINITAVDSRDVSSTPIATKTAIYKDYNKPYISSAVVERDQNGVGDDAELTLSATWWNNSFGSVSNSITDIKYYYKQTTSSTYIAGTGTITYTISGNNIIVSGVSLDGPGEQNEWDIQNAYNIKIIIEDELSSSEDFIVTLATGSPAFAISQNKVAVGGKYDDVYQSSLQVHGDINISGDYLIDGVPIGGGGGVSGDTFPIGGILPYPSSTAPTNWLVCDGSAVSRTTYAELFAVIGTNYGAGDGSTTFNLPNYKGRVPVGQDTNDTDFDTIGETGGSKYSQEHKHNFIVGNIYYQTGGTNAIVPTNPPGAGSIETSTAGTGNSGNLQPYQVSCFIIKAKQSAGVVADVANNKTNSDTDVYSCNYVNNLINVIYPVGSIYISAIPTSPSTLFGIGTWVQLKNRFLFATNDTSGNKGKDAQSSHTGKNVTNATGNTGSTTLTANQSGLRGHSHGLVKQVPYGVPYNNISGSATGASGGNYYGETYSPPWTVAQEGPWDAAEGHTHTLNNHNHGVSCIEVYAWQRTA